MFQCYIYVHVCVVFVFNATLTLVLALVVRARAKTGLCKHPLNLVYTQGICEKSTDVNLTGRVYFFKEKKELKSKQHTRHGVVC